MYIILHHLNTNKDIIKRYTQRSILQLKPIESPVSKSMQHVRNFIKNLSGQ